MINAICIISFLLDGFVSTCIRTDSLFYPLFSIVCLVVIFPYFKFRDTKFFVYAGGMGLLYDLIYTNTLYLNLLIFLLIAVIIRFLYFFVSSNILSTIFLTIFSIVLYRSFTYFLLVLIGFFPLDWMRLLEGIYSSLIINVIYIIILYFVCIWLAKRFRIRKSR